MSDVDAMELPPRYSNLSSLIAEKVKEMRPSDPFRVIDAGCAKGGIVMMSEIGGGFYHSPLGNEHFDKICVAMATHVVREIDVTGTAVFSADNHFDLARHTWCINCHVYRDVPIVAT